MGVDVASLALRVDARELDSASNSLKKFQEDADKTEGSTKKLGSAASFLVDNFKFLAGSIASFNLTSLIAESTQLNQRYQELGITLAVVGKNAGISNQQLNETAEAVRQSGISMIESRSIVTRLVQANIDLSKATTLARLAQDAAVIGQINSSEALDRLVFGITSAQVEVLRGIGINVNFEQSYAKLAKQIGVNQGALTEQDKLQARLNVVLGESAKLSGVYAAAMDNAGKQMRSTERLTEDLKVKLGGLFDQTAVTSVTIYGNVLKDLDSSLESLIRSGDLKIWGDGIAKTFAFVADAARNSTNIISGLVAGTFAQLNNLKNLDFGKFTETFDQIDKNFIAALEDSSRFRDELDAQIIARDLLVKTIDRETTAQKSNTVEVQKNTTEKSAAISEGERFIQALQTEARESGVTGLALTQLRASYLGVADSAAPFIEKLRESEAALIAQKDIAAQYSRDMDKVKSITNEVATAEDVFIAKQNELNRLLSTGLLDPGTYFKALEKAGEDLSKTTQTGAQDFKQLEFAVQGWGRSATDALVNFAVSGKASFSDFATSVLKDILRMYVQMQLITPLLQSLPGLGFGTSGGGSAASTSAASSVFGNLFKGFRANGGSVSPNSLYQVNERGIPEMLLSGGKQFLLTANQSGNVVPLKSSRSGGGGIVVNLIESPGKGGTTKQSQTAGGGIQLDIMVDQLVAKKQAEQGSASNKSLRNNFGLSNQLVMR